MSATRTELDYSYKTGFWNWRGNQDFGSQNISMNLPPLESTPIGTKTTNRKPSPIYSIPIRTKTPEHMPQTRPTPAKFQSKKGKCTYQRTRIQTHHRQTHHRVNLICRLIAITESQIVRNLIKRKSVRKTRNRTRQTHRRVILIHLTTVTIYASDIQNKKIHRKKDPIKLCARLTAKLLTTVYKSKIIKFKMDEDPIQRRIYFLNFVESL